MKRAMLAACVVVAGCASNAPSSTLFDFETETTLEARDRSGTPLSALASVPRRFAAGVFATGEESVALAFESYELVGEVTTVAANCDLRYAMSQLAREAAAESAVEMVDASPAELPELSKDALDAYVRDGAQGVVSLGLREVRVHVKAEFDQVRAEVRGQYAETYEAFEAAKDAPLPTSLRSTRVVVGDSQAMVERADVCGAVREAVKDALVEALVDGLDSIESDEAEASEEE